MRRTHVAFFAVLMLGASFASLLTLSACYSNVASDGSGDPPADAGTSDTPRALGGGARLHEINPMATLDGGPNPLHPAQDASVTVTGVSLIVVDSFDETKDGKSIGAVYVQDVGPAPVPPNSGIQVYQPNYSPPNLLIAPGDVLDMTGLYQDYAYSGFPAGETVPELYKPVVTFRFEYTAPQPTVLTKDQIPNPVVGKFSTGHQWLSMLVEIDDVDITFSSPDGKGREALAFTPDTSINGPVISNELFDLHPTDFGCPAVGGGACPKGKHLSKLIGVVTFFFGFHIAPRSAADLVP